MMATWLRAALLASVALLPASRAQAGVAEASARGEEDPAAADRLVRQGHELRAEGRHPEALVAYNDAVRAAPSSSRAHLALGNGLFDVGMHERAARSYAYAAVLDPEDDQPHVNLCNTLRLMGDVDGAVAAGETAISINPHRQIAHVNLGNALQARGDSGAAATAYARALELDPHDHIATTNLGAALLAGHKVRGAIDALERATRLRPEFAPAHINLGNARKALGDFSGAADAYRTAIALEPGDALAHNNLGSVLGAAGRTHEAAAAYARALELAPDFAPAVRNVRRATTSEAYAEAVRAEAAFLRARAAAAEAAGVPAPTAAGALASVFELLRGLETDADSPLWTVRAGEMPGAIEQLADGERNPVTLGAFAWGGVWAQALATAFGAAPVRAALRRAQRERGGAVVLGSSIGFEAFFIALAYGVPTTGVEMLPGLVALAKRARHALDLNAHAGPISFVCADAAEWPIPAGTQVVYVDDTAWDVDAIDVVARKLARELRPGAVVLHNTAGPYDTMTREWGKYVSVRVPTSWDDTHTIHIHTRL